ncbi:tetratricopeptide repeat protein [Chitinispirillales bacterium ANBcel5]|uniref:tetratricopeptide repeat protein n=1 Tax=Cellulosispirillum alkaliphilum TaxID=3039283 RepID=UPI002A57C339|nr:tetratricopeptide repeat protein [Chitinispirillales bacterium ANBcel5]
MAKRKHCITLIISLVMMGVLFNPAVHSQTQEEIRRRIEELERKRAEQAQAERDAAEQARPRGEQLAEIITRYENLLDGCATRKTDRCANVMFTLGSLYYDEGRDEFIAAQEEYNRLIEEWERRPVGPEPENPRPDYSKSIEMYKRLIEEYPDFRRLSDAYYQIGNISLISGDYDAASDWFMRLVDRFPNDPRASAARFRLGDFAYLEHNNIEAIRYLEGVRQDEVDIGTWEMVHYRKAEVYYNLGDFDKAVELFHSYVEACDAGRYPRAEFRDMALEFMAIAFSDMYDGGNEAVRFFQRIGSRPYEAYVLYTIGMKNREHGQWEAAIDALQVALDKFPMYKEAPLARQALMECYVVQREHEEANNERIRLVDDYGPGSAWYQQNSNERRVIDIAEEAVRSALGNIAIYHHSLAQDRRDRSEYEKAKDRYIEFIERFPEDKWRVFEYHYNLAEIYTQLSEYKKAAEAYDFVASADLSQYPDYRAQIDTLAMDPERLEELRAQRGDATSPVDISQEDAGFNAIVSLDKARKRAMAMEGLEEKEAYNLPESRELLDYITQYIQRFPDAANAAEVIYLAADIHYTAESYDNSIALLNQILDNYSEADIVSETRRMLANSYSFSGQHENAIGTYEQLLAQQEPDSDEYADIVNLAAGAIYRQAEEYKEQNNHEAAASTFMSIREQYPNSKVADRAWFEAGIAYEDMDDLVRAAETFKVLGSHFPTSEIRKNAYIRAAENFEKADMYERAAETYLAAADDITDAEYAIPSLSNASEAYQKLEMFEEAGAMYELIFERYQDDPKTPQALYNAGLIFESGGFYENAINVYAILAERFTDSEFAPEAFFSIGLCYEELGDHENMAKTFSEYANQFTVDRYRQVQALVRAGNAYFNMDRFSEAEENYLLATQIYDNYRETADIDINNVAQAFYRLGQIYYQRFRDIRLDASNESQMERLVQEKTEALQEPAKYFGRAIEAGVQEWTMRATYMIGMGFADMAEALSEQTLFGTEEQQIAGRIQVLSSLEPYYDRAQNYFLQNIQWAQDQNIMGEYIEQSMEKLMEMAFLKGHIMEEVGRAFANAPIPPGLDEEEQMIYQQILEEKLLEAMDAALPMYEEGIYGAAEIGIADNKWIDKIKDRIIEIDPISEALDVELETWEPEEEVYVSTLDEEHRLDFRDDEYERNMERIRNIVAMDIPVEDRIRQLNRIEMEANRNIVMEEERINQLRNQ